MGKRQFDVIVVGELNPDLILAGNVLPEFGQVEKLVEKASLTIGSSSAIFACGAARLGLKVAFIGKVGRDLFGTYMRKALEGSGIEIKGIIEDESYSTGISVILSEQNDRAILTYMGAIPHLEYGEIDQEIIRQGRHLHIGSYYIQDGLRPGMPRLFDEAHKWGLSVSLDPNYDPSGRWDEGITRLLEKVDIFLPNAVECQGIAGTANLELAQQKLRTRVKYLGIKLGKEGASLFHGENEYCVKPIRVEVADTVGAGDSFDAGFVYGYLAGWEAEQILKLANICGGLSTLKPGGTAAQPTLDEAMHYMNPAKT
jgi:sugar/nucleoside kinase (ribokinase family)